MKPENVNASDFKVEYILSDYNGFSVAYGKWNNNDYNSIAMRWNGKGNEIGYPNIYGNAKWFLIDDDLAIPIIKSLLELENSDKDLIIKALSKEFL
jgi:hypothetical protein